MSRNDFRPRARLAGRAALYLLFGGMFLAPAAVSAGLLLSFLAFLLSVSNWAALARQPVIQAALACSLYLVVLTGTLSLAPPADSVMRWDEASEWLQLLVFIPVAYLLHDNRRDLNRLLLICVSGLVLRILLRMDWELLFDDPLAYFNLREGYGFPALALALYSGTGLLGLALLRDRCRTWPLTRAADLGFLLLWLFAILVLAEVFLATQARGTWLSLVLTLLIGAVLGRRHPNAGSASRTSRWLVAAAGLLGIAALTMTPQGDAIIQRIISETGFIEAMIHGEEIKVAHSSIALRWNAQIFGIQTWLERPLTGWGPGPSHLLMVASGDPNLIVDTGEVLKHLHNSYLEVLVQTGIIGLALAGLLMALLLRELHCARHTDLIPRDLFVFLMSAMIFLLLWCLFDFRALNQDWRAFWALLAGTILSLALQRNPSPSSACPTRDETMPQDRGASGAKT